MNRLRAAVVGFLTLLTVIAMAAPASAVYINTIVVNRGPVAFQVMNDGVTKWLGVAGKTTYSQFRWTDVDAYILGSNVCARVSVNGGGYFRKGPGYYGIPQAASSVQVVSYYC